MLFESSYKTVFDVSPLRCLPYTVASLQNCIFSIIVQDVQQYGFEWLSPQSLSNHFSHFSWKHHNINNLSVSLNS